MQLGPDWQYRQYCGFTKSCKKGRKTTGRYPLAHAWLSAIVTAEVEESEGMALNYPNLGRVTVTPITQTEPQVC